MDAGQLGDQWGHSHFSAGRLCDWCGESIPATARVCRQCRNYQGGWWKARLFALGLPWFTVVFTTIAWLITQHNNDAQRRAATLKISYSVSGRALLSLTVFNETDFPILFTDASVFCNNGVRNFIADLIVSASVLPNRAIIGIISPKSQASGGFIIAEKMQSFQKKLENQTDITCAVHVKGNHDGVEVENFKYLSGSASATFFDVKTETFKKQ